ncbi:LamG domain-containing protein, partial [Candidatus Woesearchaeota archaeon]|nr:LamG domain-containing protein [Candidatus Woesearchaeota archaeon]
RYGKAYNFDGSNASGTDQRIRISDSEELRLTNQSFTISLWINRDGDLDTNIGMLLIKKHSVAPWESYKLLINDNQGGKVQFRQYDAAGSSLSDTTSNAGIPSNTWVHVVVLYNGTHQMLYIDGVKQTDVDAWSDTFDANSDLLIGSNDAGGFSYTSAFNGTIDEVALWNRSLSESEILDIYNSQSLYLSKGSYESRIYNAGFRATWLNISWDEALPYSEDLPNNDGNDSGVNMTGSVGLWHLNGDALDSSGDSNDGTINGNVTNITGKINGAYSFDGDEDYVTVVSPTFIDQQQGTFAAWVKWGGAQTEMTIASVSVTDTTDDEFFFDFRPDSAVAYGNFTDIVHLVNGAIQARLRTPNNVFEINKWHHFVATSDGSTVKAYVDGQEVTLTEQIGSNAGQWFGDATDASYFTIGGVKRATLAADWNGSIDEVAVWDRALSAEEILDIYKRGALNLNVSVRICDDASCDTETYDDTCTNASYCDLSELHKYDYFQYKVNFETGDGNYTPELLTESVIISYEEYNFCYVSTDCGSDTPIMSMSNYSNAHASLNITGAEAYDYLLCCKGINVTSNSCDEDNSVTFLKLFNYTNAHVEEANLSNYEYEACFEGDSPYVCRYGSECLSNESCIVSISNATNAHIADCTTDPYDIKVCCGEYVPPPAPNITAFYPNSTGGYSYEDIVQVDVNIAEPSSQRFNVSYEADDVSVSWYVDDVEQLDYANESEFLFTTNYSADGIYIVKSVITNATGSDEQLWELTVNATYCQIVGTITDGSESQVFSTFSIINGSGIIATNITDYSINVECEETYTVKVEPDDPGIESLYLINMSVTDTVKEILDIDDSADNLGSPAWVDSWVEAVAWNPNSSVSFDAINLTLNYTGTGLIAYKCNNWNYTGRNCTDDSWIVYEDVTNSSAYTLYSKEYGPGDPAIGIGNAARVDRFIRLYNVTGLGDVARANGGNLLGEYTNESQIDFNYTESYRIEVWLNNTHDNSNAIINSPYMDNIPDELGIDLVGYDAPNVTNVSGIITINDFTATISSGTEADTQKLTWSVGPPGKLIEGLHYGELVKLWFVVDFNGTDSSNNSATFYGDVDGTTIDAHIVNTFNTQGNGRPTAPLPWLPTNDTTTIVRTPNFVWNASIDAEGDNITYNLIVDNDADFSSPVINVTALLNASYNDTSLLDVDTTYYWKIRANDSIGYGDWSETANFTLESYLSITMIVNQTDFGSGGPGFSDNTTDNIPGPPVVQNDGNIDVNITITATPLFTEGGFPSEYYQFMIGVNESNSFNATESTTDWTNMTNSSQVIDLYNLKWDNSTDTAEIELRIELPPGEYAGNKTSTITLSTGS